MDTRFLFGMLVLTLLLSGFSTQAYYIDTGLSDPCHEKMTAELLRSFIEDNPHIAQNIPLPQTQLWEMYADAIFENFDFQIESLSQKYFIASLLIGTRWPDEHGRSVTSLSALYDTHGDPTDQQEHFLRRLEHDYDEGNIQAVNFAKEFISKQIIRTLELLDSPAEEQIIPVTEYVEFYGQITLHLWGPAYYTGTAIHTLQDSFSHTVRTNDLHQIVHVMNFIDAVSEEYNATRDGLAHSYGMDECSQKNLPITQTAQDATTDLLQIFVTPSAEVYIQLEDNWLTFHSGCNLENKFCNSIWYDNVTDEPTQPVVGCALSPPSQPNTLSWLAAQLWDFPISL